MTPREPSKIVVALSGGVDSAMTALLLKKAGWEVSAVHFVLPGPATMMEKKSEAVHEIAAFLNIPLVLVDIRSSFEHLVVQPFIDAYVQGITPNPCVMCNETVKFTFLSRVAEKQGIPFIATGHYARVESEEGPFGVSLLRGLDETKDQSYFLHRIAPAHLQKTILPLGKRTKSWVRKQAKEEMVPCHARPESQEICFLAGDDYRQLIESRRVELSDPGPIIDAGGRELGTHTGTHRYTVGQRKGLGIASSRPYYVKEIRTGSNEIVVARKEELSSRKVIARDFKWIGEKPGKPVALTAQIRYRHRAAPGILEVTGPGSVHFLFQEPQWAITPGQALVCYREDRVLGGGWVCTEDETDV